MDYRDFIETKTKEVADHGFDVDPEKLNSNLFPFQRHIVAHALKKGRFALFEDCGMGKTIQQLAWADAVCKHTGGKVIILTPLSVGAQTILEAAKFGIKAGREPESDIFITNYEQLKNIDCSKYVGVVLDESSILKNYNGSTKQAIIENFRDTKYKLACTATPSPNDHIELGNHAEFLNVMSAREMVAMYFINDAFNKDKTQKSKWRLKKSAERDFWQFVSKWALMIGKPSDIGFSDKGYILPELNIVPIEISIKQKFTGRLLDDSEVSATEYHKTLRETQDERAKRVAEIANSSTAQVLIWISHDSEGDLLRELIPDAVEVRGSQTTEQKEAGLLGFAQKKHRVLITKKKIAQYGLNFQSCSTHIDMSPDFSFEAFYQAVRRSYRFGQKKPVTYYMITTPNMSNILSAIKIKTAKFEKMKAGMCYAINASDEKKIRTGGEVKRGQGWTIYNDDCVEVLKSMEDESIHFSIFSPPFSDLYIYSDDPRDMSNSSSYGQFLDHFKFLIKELHRVTLTGRLVVMHCTQLSTLKSKEGYQSTIDFRGDLIRAMTPYGFDFFAETVIFKDAMDVARRTNSPSLLHGSARRDSSQVRMAFPDYMLAFRKRGETVKRIEETVGFDEWCKIAQPVWNDIDPSDTLKMPMKPNDSEKHMTPTQLEPLRRFIKLYSNPMEIVFSPFSGIGSEGVCAVEEGRQYIGCEIKKDYFDMSEKHLAKASESKTQITFDDILS